ncbi:hypothetical protein IMSHALPRED_002144 [Imshaugia aleurites]|uniref:MADS-box domain-containing protein n=1 Tax=Imshaugia aleurites TaxID=172621 RepID=A0A8H3J576_9LECA|nr:hypothetical protein IMSHALPRED_002144 [Imshaugia aleurites]
MPDAVKAKTQQFTRRKSNLMKKADQLARLCHADLALIIRKNDRYYMYRSTDHDQWPPTITEIKESYPLPVNLLPRDFDKHNPESRQKLEQPLTATLEMAKFESSQDP